VRVESVRGRLTLFWISALTAVSVVVGGLIYVLLARALYTRIDDNLRAVIQVTATSLTNDWAEGQEFEDAARSTAAELSSRQQMIAIYDVDGRLLAEGGRDDDLDVPSPALERVPAGQVTLLTVSETDDDDDRHPACGSRVSRRSRELAGAHRRGAGVAAEHSRVCRADRAGARRRRRMVSRATEPLARRRDGRASATDWRR
jgi:hypothetical protein